MSLMKAPKLERKHLLALKHLLRLDYARAVRFRMEAQQKNPGEHPAESTLKIMKLTDMLTDAEQPLLVTLALMEMHHSPAAWMPLDDQRFSFYERMLNLDVGSQDFPGVPADQLDVTLAPLRALQVELRKVFAEADCIDPREMHRQNGAGLSGRPAATGMMN